MKPGDIVAGKYRVVRVLAQKRGYLLEGRHTEFDQHVVIRLLAPGMCDRKEVERFRREARTLSKLESEHAARIIDVGTHSDGSFFLVRQYLEGDDLGSYIRERGALRLEEAILYVLQAAEAIQEAHSHNIIVRELSPSDLFLTKRRGGSSLVKITDFGTAKVLKDSGPGVGGQSEMTAIFGISPYASPELVRKTGDIDHRTDVWSLGCVLYELLAATMPFTGDMAELMIKITREAHIPLSRLRNDVPKQLDQIIDWALAKDPANRFSNVYALAHALGPYASAEGQVLIDRIGRLSHSGEEGEALGTTNISATSPLARSAGLESFEEDKSAAAVGGSAGGKDQLSDMERTQFYTASPSSTGTNGSRTPPPPRRRSSGVAKPVAPSADESQAIGRPSSTGSFPAQDEVGLRQRARQRKMATVAIGVAVFLIPVLAVLLFFSLRSEPTDDTTARSGGEGGKTAVAASTASAAASASDPPGDGEEGDGGAPPAEPASADGVGSGPKPTVVRKDSTARPSGGKKPSPSKTSKPATKSSARPVAEKKEPPPDKTSEPPPPPPPASGGSGTLVALAVGGSCSFTVDGQPKGTTSSIRITVPVGVHTVSCARTGDATRSRTVKVKANQPGMVMFRLN